MDQNYPVVTMEIVAEATMPDGQTYEEHLEETQIGPSFGCYELVIDGKSIHFDFNIGGYSVDGDIINYIAGSGPYQKEPYLSDYYDNDLEAVGLTRYDLTAKFLSETTNIKDIYFDTDEDNTQFEIKKISFSDGEQIYFVSDKVIAEYNEKLVRDDNPKRIIIDPESEYQTITEALGGPVIKIEADSPACINPFDLEYG